MMLRRLLRVTAPLLAALALGSSQEQEIENKPIVDGEKYNYNQVLYLSYLFYEAQRSGPLPDNNRVPWRANSAMSDGKDEGLDLTGGYYDAGDHVKFGLPMAFTVTTLAWGIVEYWDAYQASGELQHAIDAVKWGTDWIMKAHPEPHKFYCQVGNGNDDHNYWGRPEDMTMYRPAYVITESEPGTEPVAEAAASLAAAYLIFKDLDSTYSADLLRHARQLFDFGYNFQKSFTISEPFYKSWTGYKDELAWAGLWLFKATGSQEYLDKALEMYDDCCSYNNGGAFSWDSKAVGVQLLLYKITQDHKYADGVRAYLDSWHTMQRTPKGLAWFNEWAPNRYAANTAFVSLLAADYGIDPDANREWAVQQVHYLLGDCCGGLNDETKLPHFSYVIGYGDTFPRAPHHRGASCGPDGCVCNKDPQPHILYGALVGGPNKDDEYSDDCGNYVSNEVTTDYNAGFTGAIAGIKHLSLTGQLKHLHMH